MIHDVGDVFLEAGKAAKLAKADRVRNALFIPFIVIWIATRLVAFSRIIHRGILEYPSVHTPHPLFYVFVMLGMILLGLHLFWSYMIFQAIPRIMRNSVLDYDQLNEKKSKEWHSGDSSNGECNWG